MRVTHNSKLKTQKSKMKKPTQSYTELRRFVEKWQWNDPRTGQRVTGFNPPQTARNVARLPFYIRFLAVVICSELTTFAVESPTCRGWKRLQKTL